MKNRAAHLKFLKILRLTLEFFGACLLAGVSFIIFGKSTEVTSAILIWWVLMMLFKLEEIGRVGVNE